MQAVTTLFFSLATLSHALPQPQTTPTTCNTTLPGVEFFLAAIPQLANYTMLSLTTTGGGSGLEVLGTGGSSFTDAANFTYDDTAMKLSTTGAPASNTTYTSLNLTQDSQAWSFSATPPSDIGDIEAISDVSCDGLPYFVKKEEESVGIYGWTLCNDGALGWVGTSTAEPCEKVAVKAYINETATC